MKKRRETLLMLNILTGNVSKHEIDNIVTTYGKKQELLQKLLERMDPEKRSQLPSTGIPYEDKVYRGESFLSHLIAGSHLKREKVCQLNILSRTARDTFSELDQDPFKHPPSLKTFINFCIQYPRCLSPIQTFNI